MNWAGKDGIKYTLRNNPDWHKRAEWFKRIIPKGVKSVHEFGCNKGHNLQAIASIGGILVSGNEINRLARNIANKKGLFVSEKGYNTEADMILVSGVNIHLSPLDIKEYWRKFSVAKYILFIEHKEESIRTINHLWYKNAMWVMDFGKEFCDRFPFKIIKQGWVNGKPGKRNYTLPLIRTKTGFHLDDYFWLMEKK